jgi:GxxExxY protein
VKVIYREGAKNAKKGGKVLGFGESTSPEVEKIVRIVIDAIFKVHSSLGPGLLESVYSICLAYELRRRGLNVRREVMLPIEYEGVKLECGLRIDLIVEDAVIIECKAVEKMLPVFEAQLLTYLKLSGMEIGILVNFNVPLIKDGVKRMVLSKPRGGATAS